MPLIYPLVMAILIHHKGEGRWHKHTQSKMAYEGGKKHLVVNYIIYTGGNIHKTISFGTEVLNINTYISSSTVNWRMKYR